MTAAATFEQVADNIARIRQTVPPTVRIVAVTKKLPSAAIRAAYNAGLRDFGESQVQEALTKQRELQDLADITWHMIGHLQTNKAKQVLEHFHWIHAVDSLRLAQKLNQLAADRGQLLQCCLQVKMVPDPPKYGFELEELWSALPHLDDCHHLSWAGLMTIPPLHTPAPETEGIFCQARALADQINRAGFAHLNLQQLSMGMSSDYPYAIAAGATMIRLGTILFGPRPS
ncbi:hypothetical protein XM38_049040 [Halomicronema hongdechloris C2206]|uniref:Pyridoxal phosphate homeostasis protein n=1 Tax=Halomicronema hongdechloris C2206 TaxID=1641165 RepID=A0A1Z3HUD3_9CYAN|nr:YggS family pyridoxal phosphate-dependent enzyme [Halomicronema hongdechloris]ASC73930.1 hypothetical protein XM38_049040 [Halomicronema hongdechloris C2206]